MVIQVERANGRISYYRVIFIEVTRFTVACFKMLHFFSWFDAYNKM